jgi:hypothetical protein
MTKFNRINKSDYFRILLTETIPFEVPIIFTNEGFYRHFHAYKNENYPLKDIFESLICDESDRSTTPVAYKIRKNAISLRTLSLIHPFAQNKFIEFYKKFSGIICYHCSNSQISLRSPHKIGSVFYVKSRLENTKKYKTDSIDTLKQDLHTKNSSSYFAYSGFDRLYKFFESEKYFKLEKKFSSMWIMDVAKCFDSIYTHTISWAVKTKEFAKDTIGYKSSFGQQFDIIMQRCNDNETNGIIIGPEFSRIFAETIFQDIDSKVIENLKKKHQLEFNKDYCIKRYVDDIFVFAIKEDLTKTVAEEYIDQLSKYNLHINEKKLEKYTRPFYTKQSRIIRSTSIEINNFFGKFTKLRKSKKGKIVTPKTIFRTDRLAHDFINSIKAICLDNKTDFESISSFIISSFLNRIINLLATSYSLLKKKNITKADYKNSMLMLLDIIYYFYSIAPTVSASYSLGQSVISIDRFFESEAPEFKDTVKQRILELSVNLLKQRHFIEKDNRDGLVPLEKLNIILSISDLGENYLLPQKLVKDLFYFEGIALSYFEIISCLYYCRSHSIYSELRKKIESIVKKKLANLSDIEKKSDIAYLFLDTLSCPYLSSDHRKKILKRYLKKIQKLPSSETEYLSISNYIMENEWFVSWKDVDLLNILEKKKQRSVY